ncbi:MAG: ABC transporter ATP-binding protein [Tenericutes bacterium HGW-Tenericutes-1]|jgi:putative ABC transport system permease protein|nr:MAG: ABC transporter ATP-binding protein [Tenericutes bacterium HGW-Tenericutes-1]
MLQIKEVKKAYQVGDFKQVALNGISVSFRKNEFVAIVGQSGSGKTTTLNIIGGLDRYDSGDIIIKGKSTKDFKDPDWDAYRNNSIGFVFQNYNLINHITVLDNVEMGMTLSGLPSKQRRKRAIEVLDRVGLKDHMYKRPNQLSGGQMQRVAIARALSNNPEIIMADEPTGALDSQTSIQIMELIKEIAQDKLVILVTHNIHIAEQYANRIITMSDGNIVKDTNPYVIDSDYKTEYKLTKTSMSFKQALNLSFNNLKTKLGRALITAFAGSIGIIGVGLVLSLSNGLNQEINSLETGTLSDFPLTISESPMYMQMRPGRYPGMDENTEGEFPTGNELVITDSSENSFLHYNKLTDDYVEYVSNIDPTLYNDVSYGTSLSMNLLIEVEEDVVSKVQTNQIGWSELPNNTDFIFDNYDILEGAYPTNKNQLLLVVDSYNTIDIQFLTALGISDSEGTLDFSEFVGMEFRIVPNDDYYVYSDITSLYNITTDLLTAYNSPDAISLSISGIARVKQDANGTILNEGIGYLSELTTDVMTNASTSDIALAQVASDTSVMTGLPLTEAAKRSELRRLGALETPNSIRIYPVDFNTKNEIKTYLDSYNDDMDEGFEIYYLDLAETITDTVGTLIDTITYVLVAFSAISLVVSSIMIGIITYVSVLERTKEIGILRALGARKKDISRVFNAETILIGLTAGAMGVFIAWILTFPINKIIGNLVEEMDAIAKFSSVAMLSLIAISVVLTLFSGLIPSRIAAKKDPVEALRSE